MEPRVLEWIGQELRPHRMAYLSCSPASLGRNLLVLKSHSYRVEAIHPFDFFPHTHHVECLALLQRA